jgi:photosystem II CP47 chlorophyll apoprotein
LDLNQILGIHLHFASLLSFGFGLAHLSGFKGPGIWTSDSFGLVGSIRFVKPIYSVIGLAPFCYGVISSNHILAGFLGLGIGLWHISSRPSPRLYKLLKMGNVEEVLSSSIAAVFFTAFLMSALMWYGCLSAALELFGPSRYQWDNGYFSLDIERRVNYARSIFLNKAWEQVPEKLVLYDYLGCNPSKGGLFRSGPILKGDGVVQNWLGHASFEIGTLSLAIRRMPAFFETFPVILIDQGGTLRADIPFRRAESRYSMQETNVVLDFSGGILNATEYSTPSLVKDYARKAQFGEIFRFSKKTGGADGVFRTSPRGWYSFSHTAFAVFFFFGHLWHASRAVFQDLWTGLCVTIESLDHVEYGRILAETSFL